MRLTIVRPSLRTGLRYLSLLSLVCLSSGFLSATYLYNNTGSTPPPLHLAPGGIAIIGASIDDGTSSPAAAQFTPTLSGSLTEIDVYLYYQSDPNFSGEVTMEIYTDSNGAPGSQIGNQSWTFPASTLADEIEIPVITGTINLVANTPYWLVALPGASNTYVDWTDSAVAGAYAQGIQNPGQAIEWDVYPAHYDSVPFLAIQGTTTPEPEALWMAGLGFASMCLGKLRRRLPKNKPS